MDIQFNASVIANDGQRVGLLQEVVVDPRTREIAYLAVKQGLLFENDQLVPVDLIEEAHRDTVYLNVGAEDIQNHAQPYDDTQFASLSEEETEAGKPAGKLWMRPIDPQGSVVPPGITSLTVPPSVSFPADDVGLLSNNKTILENGAVIGTVKTLLTDDEGKLTHIVVSEGVVFKEPKVLPVDWIVELRENEIIVAGDAATINQLPDYEGDL